MGIVDRHQELHDRQTGNTSVLQKGTYIEQFNTISPCRRKLCPRKIPLPLGLEKKSFHLGNGKSVPCSSRYHPYIISTLCVPTDREDFSIFISPGVTLFSKLIRFFSFFLLLARSLYFSFTFFFYFPVQRTIKHSRDWKLHLG